MTCRERHSIPEHSNTDVMLANSLGVARQSQSPGLRMLQKWRLPQQQRLGLIVPGN